MAKVTVVGGGPSGMLAAACAALGGHDVTLFEHNEKLGKKLYITGKGRCNLTNASDNAEFLAKVTHNARFLYSALARFGPADLMALLERLGVPLKCERGNRVYPASDKSSDILRALEAYVRQSGVDVRLRAHVSGITHDSGQITGVEVDGAWHGTDALILCTGGCSYPATGSRGDGFAFLRALGHTVLKPMPSLVPIRTEESWPGTLAGLTLKNITLSAMRNGKRIYEALGELLFTHDGVSGPLALSLSSIIAGDPAGVKLAIDLKPGLRSELLDARLQRDISENPKKQAISALSSLMPQRLLPHVIAQSGFEGTACAGEMTRRQRLGLVQAVKALELHVAALHGFDEAVVTRGGVSVSEVDPKTMASRVVKGLYIAGELLDVDAMTGGFNLQIAFTTGFVAGTSI